MIHAAMAAPASMPNANTMIAIISLAVRLSTDRVSSSSAVGGRSIMAPRYVPRATLKFLKRRSPLQSKCCGNIAYARSGLLFSRRCKSATCASVKVVQPMSRTRCSLRRRHLLCLGAPERLSVTGCEAERGKLIRVMAYCNRPQHHERR